MTFEEAIELEKAKGRKPKRHLDDKEHRMQCDCVRWFRYQYSKIADLLFAIPNGGARSKREGGVKRAEGMTAGVADLILLRSNRHFGALCIEMKTSTGKQSESQKRWQKLVEDNGGKYVVCRSLEEFIAIVKDYMKDVDT